MSTNMIASFPLVEVRTQGTAGVGNGVGTAGLDAQLGQRVEIYTTISGVPTRQVYMLVEANLSAGNFDARGKLFKWQDRTAFQVRPCSATTDVVAGIAPYRDPMNPAAGTSGAIGISSLDTTDYFWICVEADMVEVIHGDDGTNTFDATNKYLTPDNDADLGKIAGTTTFATGVTNGRFVSGTAADNAVMITTLRESV